MIANGLQFLNKNFITNNDRNGLKTQILEAPLLCTILWLR